MRANVPSSRSHRHGASGPHFIPGSTHAVGESSSCQTSRLRMQYQNFFATMNAISTLLRIIHAVVAGLFALSALMLIFIATRMGWRAMFGTLDSAAAQGIIEAVGLLAAAVVALQISKTIIEEEIIRDADISAPTRVRRFLSRFFVVVVVALAVEGLVATFKGIHEDLSNLAYAAMLIAAIGVLLASWGVFIHLNRTAEELEPEAMADAKREDRKLHE